MAAGVVVDAEAAAAGAVEAADAVAADGAVEVCTNCIYSLCKR